MLTICIGILSLIKDREGDIGKIKGNLLRFTGLSYIILFHIVLHFRPEMAVYRRIVGLSAAYLITMLFINGLIWALFHTDECKKKKDEEKIEK